MVFFVIDFGLGLNFVRGLVSSLSFYFILEVVFVFLVSECGFDFLFRRGG